MTKGRSRRPRTSWPLIGAVATALAIGVAVGESGALGISDAASPQPIIGAGDESAGDDVVFAAASEQPPESGIFSDLTPSVTAYRSFVAFLQDTKIGAASPSPSRPRAAIRRARQRFEWEHGHDVMRIADGDSLRHIECREEEGLEACLYGWRGPEGEEIEVWIPPSETTSGL